MSVFVCLCLVVSLLANDGHKLGTNSILSLLDKFIWKTYINTKGPVNPALLLVYMNSAVTNRVNRQRISVSSKYRDNFHKLIDGK